MNIRLFDDSQSEALRPITSTRSIGDIRLGFFSIFEKWEKALAAHPALNNFEIKINARYLPTKELVAEIVSLPNNSTLTDGAVIVAILGTGAAIHHLSISVSVIMRLSDLFSLLGTSIAIDATLTKPLQSSNDMDGVRIIGLGKHPLIVGKGAKAEGAILNLSEGPILLGRDSEIMEGAMVRGPFALGDYSQVKMGAKIYGPTAIGPHCKVGGELSNVLILGYSNKAHDGFLGNSVIGEWCNLGADTNCSNLKNNYAKVKQWNYASGHFENTGLQFCGLVMGDHAKAGINTMFNTGTVVGVGANVFGGGFPPTFIPDFSWGGAAGLTEFQFEKFLETAQSVMQRRGLTVDEATKDRLARLFEDTRDLRNATI